MNTYNPLLMNPAWHQFAQGDSLVIFGEVFDKGYVNGLIQQAQQQGLPVIYSTVGRRDDTLQLRPLNQNELEAKQQEGQSPPINIPLEAGFDLYTPKVGTNLVDDLRGFKLSQWQEAKLDFNKVADVRALAQSDFQQRVQQWVEALRTYLPPSTQRILFVHTMAGGFPRAKIIMPCANRVFKGTGDRFASSKTFWQSDLGRLCEQSFESVTADTFDTLITTTQQHFDVECCYAAYGYHGTECLVGDQYQWQSYAPYLQGWAKLKLERIATQAHTRGLKAYVFNVPEILTQSSSIFLGVEVALYSLIAALQKEGAADPSNAQSLESKIKALLKPEFGVSDLIQATQEYLTHPVIRAHSDFNTWPQHNSAEQMLLMQQASKKLMQMHQNSRHMATLELSELIFKACGRIMLNLMPTRQPHACHWIGHKLIASL